MYRRGKPRVLIEQITLYKLPNGYRVNLGTTGGLKNQSPRGSCGGQLFHFMHGDRRKEWGGRECWCRVKLASCFQSMSNRILKRKSISPKAVEPGEPITVWDLPVLMSLCRFLLALPSMRNFGVFILCELPFIFHELDIACLNQLLYGYDNSDIYFVYLPQISFLQRQEEKDYFPAITAVQWQRQQSYSAVVRKIHVNFIITD